MLHKENNPTCASGWWNRQLFTFTRRLHYHKPAAGKKTDKFSPQTTSLPTPQKIHQRRANDLGELACNQIGRWGGIACGSQRQYQKVASWKWRVLLCTHVWRNQEVWKALKSRCICCLDCNLQPSTPIVGPNVIKQTENLKSRENITGQNKETPAVKTNSLVGDKGA